MDLIDRIYILPLQLKIVRAAKLLSLLIREKVSQVLFIVEPELKRKHLRKLWKKLATAHAIITVACRQRIEE